MRLTGLVDELRTVGVLTYKLGPRKHIERNNYFPQRIIVAGNMAATNSYEFALSRIFPALN